MSKAFEKFLEQSKKEGFTVYPGDIHHAAYVAWNAAIEHAAAYIEQQSLPDMYSEPCLKEFAEAIRKEKTE